MLDDDPLDRRPQADLHTPLLRELHERPHERAGPPARVVDAPPPLEPVDEQIDGRPAKGIPTDEQGLEAEHLPQPLVPDVPRHQAMHGAVALEAGHRRQHAKHRRGPVERLIRQLLVPDGEDPLRLLHQRAIPVDVGRVEAADLLQQPVLVADEVEGLTGMELDPVERVDRHQLDVVLEPLAEEGEQLLEQMRRRDDRRAGVEGEPVLPEDPRPSARLIECLAERDAIAPRAKPQRGGDAAEPRTDHDGVRPGTLHRDPSAISPRRCASSSRHSRRVSSRVARASPSTSSTMGDDGPPTTMSTFRPTARRRAISSRAGCDGTCGATMLSATRSASMRLTAAPIADAGRSGPR